MNTHIWLGSIEETSTTLKKHKIHTANIAKRKTSIFYIWIWLKHTVEKFLKSLLF